MSTLLYKKNVCLRLAYLLCSVRTVNFWRKQTNRRNRHGVLSWVLQSRTGMLSWEVISDTTGAARSKLTTFFLCC